MDAERNTILIVEDDDATRTFLADNLCADGYEPLPADCAKDGLRLLETKFPDLAIVDVMLPDLSGLDLVATVRGADGVASRVNPRVPLLLISGRTGELDRIRGFERGCDDYVCKPFSYAELRGRIAALLRRSNQRTSLGRLRVGPLEIDPPAREVLLRGHRVELSQKEFALLRSLAVEPTRVWTKAELLKHVWGFRAMGSTRTLDSHACRLRQKLGREGDRFVVNVWGVGYRLVDGPASYETLVGEVAAALTALALSGWIAAAWAVAIAVASRRGRGRRAELVARASHELRGPLTAARLGLHFLGDSARLRAIDAELRRVARALDDLDAARAGRRARDEDEPIEVARLLADAALAWDPVAREHGARVFVHGADGLVVRGDRTRLAQACGNLLANAVEHGGGPIELRARAVGRRVRIEVADHGPGLPAPVGRLVARARNGRGRRGRGLAIASEIALRHGGRLAAAPSARGARLMLELPAVRPPRRAP